MPQIRNIQAERLRAMLNEAAADPTKILPHAITHDGLSAKLCEEAGFKLAFMGGFAVAASHGLPDVGYLQCAEMCERIRQITAVTSLPLMADGDTGYGNAMNVRRTMYQYAQSGAAGGICHIPPGFLIFDSTDKVVKRHHDRGSGLAQAYVSRHRRGACPRLA